jgi:hypothetical protein
MNEEKWKGSYTLGKSYSKGLAGKTVNFVMILKIDNGKISGYCQDIGEIEDAFDKPAVIEGSLNQGKIVFTKKYPGMLVVDEENYYAFPDSPSSEITYKGVLKTNFFSRKKHFKGTWDLKAKFLNEDNEEITSEHEGTWLMERDH